MSAATLNEEIDRRGVVTVTFNRSDKGNAYNQVMLEALFDSLARHAADSSSRMIVLRGAGKHFCAGADIDEHDAPAAPPRVTLPSVCRALDDFPKPTVALIHGACIGGGLAFAACCDVVIGVSDAVFSLPEVRLGFAPVPLVGFLVRAIYPRYLRRYLISGEQFDAEEAFRIGLVHELCDASATEVALAKTIDSLLEAAPLAGSTAKQELQARRRELITDDLLAELQAAFRRSFESAESKEGRAAFRQKRKPYWVPKRD